MGRCAPESLELRGSAYLGRQSRPYPSGHEVCLPVALESSASLRVMRSTCPGRWSRPRLPGSRGPLARGAGVIRACLGREVRSPGAPESSASVRVANDAWTPRVEVARCMLGRRRAMDSSRRRIGAMGSEAAQGRESVRVHPSPWPSELSSTHALQETA